MSGLSEILIWLALVGGTAAAAAALYGHYYVLPGWLTGPEICRLEDGGCAVLFRSPRSALLGIPNATLGLRSMRSWPRDWSSMLRPWCSGR